MSGLVGGTEAPPPLACSCQHALCNTDHCRTAVARPWHGGLHRSRKETALATGQGHGPVTHTDMRAPPTSTAVPAAAPSGTPAPSFPPAVSHPCRTVQRHSCTATPPWWAAASSTSFPPGPSARRRTVHFRLLPPHARLPCTPPNRCRRRRRLMHACRAQRGLLKPWAGGCSVAVRPSRWGLQVPAGEQSISACWRVTAAAAHARLPCTERASRALGWWLQCRCRPGSGPAQGQQQQRQALR